MAINVERYKASSKTLLGKITPFFLRGKNLMRFLSAIVSPIDSVNEKFREWCKWTIVDAVTTSQIIVLKWSMKTKLERYILNKDSYFDIQTYGRTSYTTLYQDISEELLHPEADVPVSPENPFDGLPMGAEPLVLQNRDELKDESNDITVVAPAFNSKAISETEYIRKIKQCIQPYLAYDIPYIITISDN